MTVHLAANGLERGLFPVITRNVIIDGTPNRRRNLDCITGAFRVMDGAVPLPLRSDREYR